MNFIRIEYISDNRLNSIFIHYLADYKLFLAIVTTMLLNLNLYNIIYLLSIPELVNTKLN